MRSQRYFASQRPASTVWSSAEKSDSTASAVCFVSVAGASRAFLGRALSNRWANSNNTYEHQKRSELVVGGLPHARPSLSRPLSRELAGRREKLRSCLAWPPGRWRTTQDRKSTRLHSSH